MKKFLLMFFVLLAHMNAFAEKSVYIPDEWRNQLWRSDTLLYAESDPENKYTWSKSRSMETENFIIFVRTNCQQATSTISTSTT